MRKHIFILAILASLITSCLNKDFEPAEWGIDPELDFSRSGLVFNSLNTEQKIKVYTNYNDFKVISTDDWCKVTIERDSSFIVVEVSPNKSTEQRMATIMVEVGKGKKLLSKNISVVQMGGYWDMEGEFSLFWSYDVSDTQKEIITNMLNNMVYVEGGTFVMGTDEQTFYSTTGIPFDNYREYYTQHQVTLSDYYISKYELTQKEWNALMAENNSRFVGPDLPVENITWEETVEFISRLSKLTNIDFQLPTESQWEYAARGGKYSLGYVYSGSNNWMDVAWLVGASVETSDPRYTTSAVGQKAPNELGLYDMSGNVSEFCFDWYAPYPYEDQIDPVGPSIGKRHVVRGGEISYGYAPYNCSVFQRWEYYTTSSQHIGIRLVIKK